MKKMLLSVALVLAGAGFARADEPSTPPPPTPSASPTSPAGGGDQTPPPAGHRGMRAAFVLGELTSKLSLTADQQKTIGPIIASGIGQLRALRQDESLSQEDRRAQAKSILEQERTQIRAALTPDQQKIFDTLRLHGPAVRPSPTPTPAS
jgi:hypothetical protein